MSPYCFANDCNSTLLVIIVVINLRKIVSGNMIWFFCTISGIVIASRTCFWYETGTLQMKRREYAHDTKLLADGALVPDKLCSSLRTESNLVNSGDRTA